MNTTSSRFVSRWAGPALFLITGVAGALGANVTFYGVGQLPGGALNSEIRDAISVPSGILAVGNAQGNPAAALSDTAILWTPSDGIFPLHSFRDVPLNPGSRFVTASQIATGKLVIASRTSTETTGRFPFPALYNPGGPLVAVLGLPSGMIYGAASSISSNGKITYGFCVDSSFNFQGFRWSVADGPTQLPAIPGYASITPAAKGCSADGSIDVGAASTADGTEFAPGSAAYIFTAATNTMSLLPMAPGGTWAGAAGVDPTGTYIVGAGNSPANPGGEVLLWTGNTVTELGVPAAEASTGVASNFAGVTKNGAVVVILGNVGSYLHNSYGWFDLQTALTSGGGNLSGWSLLVALGVSQDGTLVFGRGTHNGGVEGFVAQVSGGFLEKYGKPKKG